MPVTPSITIPAANTLLGDATPIYHTNFTNLKDAVVAVSTTVDGLPSSTALNDHKNSGDHDAHNDGRYAPIGTALKIVSAPFLASGATPYIPLPVGTILSVAVTNEDGQVGVSTVGKNITVENTLMRVTDGGGLGVLPLFVGGTQYSSISLTGVPQFVVITMV